MPSASRKKLFIAALATALSWWLAMTQAGLFALGWVAFVPLLLAAAEIPSPRARFFYGWCAGFLCFALHNWWLLPTIAKASVVVGVPFTGGVLLGICAVILIALGHGLGPAALALLWNPRAPLFRNTPLLLSFCSAWLWLAFEWLRGSGALAHSWGAPAFSQWSDPALLQSVPFLGQHGLSALCVWFAACLALWLLPENSARVPNLWRVPVVVFALLHLWGGWRIYRYDRQAQTPTRVLLVATDIASLSKKREGGESHFAAAERLTREYFTAPSPASNSLPPALVVWPETTLTLGLARNAAEQQSGVEALSDEFAIPILAGSQTFGMDGSLANEAVLVTRDGVVQRSGKMHVVPFGERAPFVNALPFLAQLAPQPPVTPAKEVVPLEVNLADGKTLRIGTVICFESAFSHPAKTLVNQGAQVLFVLTNDEWFEGTSAPWEHAAMCAIRAAENNVPVVQVSNGGYSLVTDALGRFIFKSKSGSSRALEGVIPLSLKD